MSPRRRKLPFWERAKSMTGAIVLHAVLLVVLLVNFTRPAKEVVAFDADKIDTVVASAVDEQQLKEQLDAIKKQEEDRERERQEKIDELERLAAEEQQRKQDLEALERKQQAERDAAERLEAERKAIALKKKEDEERAERERLEREAREKKERERLARIKRERELAEKKQREEEEKRLAAQKAFEEQLAREQQAQAERRARERTTRAINQALADIENKIKRLRTVSPGVDPWRVARVEIKVDSVGNVLSVNTVIPSGDPRYDKDAESAVLKASPLPLPDQTQFADAHRDLVNESFLMDIKAN